MVEGFRTLTTWQKAYELALEIYMMTKDLEYINNEKYRMIDEKRKEVARLLKGLIKSSQP